MKKQYLGDSVYASFDGDCVVLTTENGFPDDPRNRIVLGPAVFFALRDYFLAAHAQKFACVPQPDGGGPHVLSDQHAASPSDESVCPADTPRVNGRGAAA